MQESLSAYLIDGDVEAVGYSSPGERDGHRHPFTVVTSPDGSKLVQIGPAGEDGHEHTVDEWSPKRYGMHLLTSTDYGHNHSINFGTGQREGPTVGIGMMGESCHCGGSCGPCSLQENDEQQTNVRRTQRTVRKVVRAVTRQAGPPVRVKSHTRRPRSESWGGRGDVVEAVDDRNIARVLVHGDWIPDVGKARKAAQAIVRVFSTRDTARMLQRFGPMSAAVKGRIAKVLEPWMDAVKAREAAEAVLGSMEKGARGRRWYEGLGEKEKKGLWHNIRKKRERGEPPAKPGDEDYPDEKGWKRAQEAVVEKKGPAKGKAKVHRTGDGKKVSYGAKGAKVKPGTKKGDAYCARSAAQMKDHPKAAKDPDSPLRLSRKRWRCKGSRSESIEESEFVSAAAEDRDARKLLKRQTRVANIPAGNYYLTLTKDRAGWRRTGVFKLLDKGTGRRGRGTHIKLIGSAARYDAPQGMVPRVELVRRGHTMQVQDGMNTLAVDLGSNMTAAARFAGLSESGTWGDRGAVLLERLSGWSKVPDGYTATLGDGGIVQLTKEGRSWVVKVDGTIIQDLGKKASFDYAEGAVAQFLKKTGRR